MKFIIILILLLVPLVSYSQEISENYDKFKKTSEIRLDSDIDLKVNTKTGTFDFEINIIRVSNDSDTVYYLTANSQSVYQSWCGEGLEAIILLDDSNIVNLISSFGDFKAGTFWAYWIGYEISKDQLVEIYNAKKIEIKCYLREGSLQASFRNDDRKKLNSYLKNYLLKGTVI